MSDAAEKVDKGSDPAPRRRSRLWSITFVISLALNLFVGGLILGHAIFGPSPLMMARNTPYNVFWAGRAAGPDAEERVRAIWEARREEIRASVATLRDSQRTIIEGLGASELDDEALGAALQELRQRTMASQAIMHRDFVELLGRLTAQQRADIAQAARDAGRRAERRMERARESRPPPPQGEAPPPGM